MKKHLPNFITSLNLLTGGVGCIWILEKGPENAIFFVLIAGLFDFLDGMIARMLKVNSAIGKELDSLADVISFGLLPAFFVVAQIKSIGQENEWLPFVGLLIVIFSALRLAKFNVDDRQTDQFIGLPTPANAIMITSLVFLPDNFMQSTYFWMILSVLSSLLLVAPISMIALKFKNLGWQTNSLKYAFIILVLIFGLVLKLQALPLIIPTYIVLSIFGNFQVKRSV